MNIPIVAKIALCILLTSLSWPARSQDQYEYRVGHFTPEDGLSSNSVYAIQEDSLGFLWLGTMNGLVCYDGYTFETFLPRQGDSTSIGGSHIVALHIDAKGHLWAGGGYQDPAGFNRFEVSTERFTRYRHDPKNPNSLIDDEVTSLATRQRTDSMAISGPC